jgi:hypothetical protein
MTKQTEEVEGKAGINLIQTDIQRSITLRLLFCDTPSQVHGVFSLPD